MAKLIHLGIGGLDNSGATNMLATFRRRKPCGLSMWETDLKQLTELSWDHGEGQYCTEIGWMPVSTPLCWWQPVYACVFGPVW